MVAEIFHSRLCECHVGNDRHSGNTVLHGLFSDFAKYNNYTNDRCGGHSA